ncbi:hypothetical protein SEA_ATUIN_220 [Arthrobacter phage Atuin]|nr:hypothetical protein SEA_ATUIN_19 [Arthrobacter phage Atuin]
MTRPNLPKAPDGYFWSVKPDAFTGSAYLHLMKPVDLYFFKFNRSVYRKYIYFSDPINTPRVAHEILKEIDMYGDYR